MHRRSQSKAAVNTTHPDVDDAPLPHKDVGGPQRDRVQHPKAAASAAAAISSRGSSRLGGDLLDELLLHLSGTQIRPLR